MITDRQNRFSLGQAITAAATTVSTNVIDLGAATNVSRASIVMRLFVRAAAAFVGGTNVTVNLIQSDTPNMASPDILATTGAIVTASLTLGAILADLRLPNVTKRYIALQYVSTGTYTAGALDAFLAETTDSRKLYPAATGL